MYRSCNCGFAILNRNSFDIQSVVRLGAPLLICGVWSRSPQGVESSEAMMVVAT